MKKKDKKYKKKKASSGWKQPFSVDVLIRISNSHQSNDLLEEKLQFENYLTNWSKSKRASFSE